jgi:hypothetical protein
MKRLALVLSLLALPAAAQTRPSPEEVETLYLQETGQLRSALAGARLEIAGLKKQLEELKVKDQNAEAKK